MTTAVRCPKRLQIPVMPDLKAEPIDEFLAKAEYTWDRSGLRLKAPDFGSELIECVLEAGHEGRHEGMSSTGIPMFWVNQA